MSENFKKMAAHDYEQLIFFNDSASKLRAIVAIHNTVLGPGLGGTRMFPYQTETQAVDDVLRLARGMTYKAAMAGLNLGGGKAVIIGDPHRDKTPDLFEAFGRGVEWLGGRYITTEDSGTAPPDMEIVRRKTRYVCGAPVDKGGSGDPSPVTALGCFEGVKACLAFVGKGDSLKGVKVALQGVGHVGLYLLEHLVAAGAQVIITDVDPDRIGMAKAKGAVEVVKPDEIYDVKADIFSPNALGHSITHETLPRIKAKIIAGGANNQLADPKLGDEILKRNILYAPDYVINAGGLINVWSEYFSCSKDRVAEKVKQIPKTLKKIFDISKTDKVSTAAVSDQLAEERIRKGRTA